MKSALVCLSAAALFTCTLVGCGQKRPDGVEGEGVEGAIGVALQLAPGLTLNTARYTITGPGGFSRSDTVNLTNSSKLTFTVGGIPAGTGYLLNVTATLADGVTTCIGEATFAVTARATTVVALHVRCHEPPRNGTVTVNGT